MKAVRGRGVSRGPTIHLALRLLCAAPLFLPVQFAAALTNGLALTPPMGWNDWYAFKCNINQSIVQSAADAMATNGMKAAGYQFVNIDDCWQVSRDANGVIFADPARFPDGIKSLADYVHADGLKLGLYTSHGTATCKGKPGSYGYEYLDANTYAAWGVDFLKDDACRLPSGDNPQADFFRMSDGLMKSGRPMVFSLCEASYGYEYWSPDLGNLWRTTSDIAVTFGGMLSHIDPNSRSAWLAGPGRWNDPDILQVGLGVFTNLIPAQTHFTMWCIMAAPLLAGNDLTSMSAQTLSVLTNPEAIAVDQDPAGEQATWAGGTQDAAEVWSKPLGYDFTARAVALLNRSTTSSASITCAWTNLGLRPGAATVRDLWLHQDLGVFTNAFTTNVPPQGVVFLKVVGTPPSPPGLGTNYLSDLQPIYAYVDSNNVWVAASKDKSIGGHTLTLDGVAYSKGLGVTTTSGLEFNLGGGAARFQSDIGVDDEVGGSGSVIFQVLADGTRIYDSGIMTGSAARKTVDLDITGVRRLTLGVTDTINNVTGDRSAVSTTNHADWAGAKVIVTSASPLPPNPPSGLSARSGNPICLSWNPTLGAISYNVKRATSRGGPFAMLGNVPFPAFADRNTVVGATYFYVVSAVSSFGEGADSTEANAASCQPPPAPTNVQTIVSGETVTLTWNSVPGATSYSVLRSTSATPYALVSSGLATTSFSDSNVVTGLTYYYVVTASNACNQSDYSAFAPAVVPVPLDPLQITQDLPERVTVVSGRSYIYLVGVTGSTPWSCQWYHAGAPLAGQTNFACTVTAGSPGTTTYCVVITNLSGAVTSSVSLFTSISPPPPPTNAYAANLLQLNPAGYWPMHETQAAAPGDIELNYGTLGPLGAAYYPDWTLDASTNAFVRGWPGALANDTDTALHFNKLISSSPGAGTWTNVLYVPHSSPWATLNPPFSVECWFYPTNAGGGSSAQSVWGQHGFAALNAGYAGSGNGPYKGIQLNFNGSFQVYVYSNGVQIATAVSPSAPINQWHHLVATCDAATNITLFLDGTAGATVAAAGKYMPDYWTPLTIGGTRGGTRSAAGSIDEFAVYTNVISDVGTHYHDALAGAPGRYFDDVVNDHPVIYLRMDAPAYTPPPSSAWPILFNYGSAGVQGVYTPGAVPGIVNGPATPGGTPLNGLGRETNVAQLSGVSSFADAGYTSAYDPVGATPFSVSAMFRGSPCDNRRQTVVGHSDNSWRITMNTNGTLQCQLGTNTSSLINSARVYNDGNWHQVVEVYMPASNPTVAGTHALYVDGVLDSSISTVSTNGIVPGSTLNVLIGSDPQYTNNPAGVGRQFAGQICEVAFFTTALTAAQVQQLYNVTLPSVNPNPTNIVFAVTGNQLTLSWPADHTGWRLLAQTNSLTGPWGDVSGSQTTNQVSVPLDPNNGSVFYRLIYP